MSDQGRLSIWKGDPAMDSWYTAAVHRNATICNNSKGDMEEMLFFDIAKSNQVKYPSGAANDWFYGASTGGNDTIETHTRQITTTSPTLSGNGLVLLGLESSWFTSDKPLPPVPSSPTNSTPSGIITPYFEYIFANAGVESQAKYGMYSPENVSFEIDNDVMEHEMSEDNDTYQVDDAPSPEDFTPRTPEYCQDAIAFQSLDDAGFPTHAFLRAGISVTSKDPVDNYSATANNTGHFFLNEANEAQKAAARTGFFGGFAVEKSPSPYHAPIVDRSSGFGDIRDRAEDFSQQWQDNERRPKAYTLEEANAMFEDYPIDATSIQTRPILTPNSRIIAATKVQDVRGNSPMVIDLTIDEGSRKESSCTGKKRKAHDSFVTKSFFDSSSSDDDDVQHLYTKRARTASNGNNDVGVEMVGHQPTYNLIDIPDADLEHMSTKSETASAIFAKIAPAPVSYPGQFCGVMTLEQAMCDSLTSSSTSANNKTTTMGNYLHPNYLFTHTNFCPCPHENKLDFSMRTARPGTQLFRSIEFADELSDRAADIPRTSAEEALRCEVHHESALARLEGVSIGEYRYYQGHLNIEEYKEAGMCVCWEACECAKMCTRFPDMLCPCSKHIEIHKY